MSSTHRRRLVVLGVVCACFAAGLLVWLALGSSDVLGTADQLSSVASLLVAIFALTVTVLPLVPGLEPSEPPKSLDDVVEELAKKIQSQWEKESQARRVNDPYPLPVTWRPAPGELVVGWRMIVETVRRKPAAWHVGGSTPGASPEDLVADRLSTALSRVPTGRLVVLGERGSGKTILLVQLTLDLLEHRSGGDPVPVLLSVTSWSPKTETLQEWLAATLKIEYPWLTRTVPGSAAGRTCLEALLDDRRILPILDGLDEIPGEVRRSALEEINAWLHDGDRIVVSSRTNEYALLVGQAADTVGVMISAAAGIILEPLSARAVADYLVTTGGGSNAARDRWAPVTERLAGRGVLTSALHTPLMASLARTIYNPRHEESAQNLPAPKALVEIAAKGSVDAVREHLFDGFVRAAYRTHPDPKKRCPWSTRQAERWLIHLARHLEALTPGRSDTSENRPARTARTTDLAWWELHRAVHPATLTLLASILPGVAVGFAALLGPSLGIGLGVGLLLGILPPVLIVATRGDVHAPRPGRARTTARPARTAVTTDAEADRTRAESSVLGIGVAAVCSVATAAAVGALTQPGGARTGLVGAIGVALGAGPIGGTWGSVLGGTLGGIGVGFTAGRAPGWPAGVLDGLGGGLAAGAILALAGRQRPALGVRATRWTRRATVAGAMAGIGMYLAAGPVVGVIGFFAGCCLGLLGQTADVASATTPERSRVQDRNTFLVLGVVSGLLVFAGAGRAVIVPVGIAGGITVGLVFAGMQAAWGRYTVARLWLAVRRKVPLRLSLFLHDAHEHRGVLRQVGSVYQFRHAELQRHLAGSELPERHR